MLSIVAIVIDHLDLESVRGGMAADGRSQCDAIVSCRWQLKLKSDLEVLVLFLAE